MQGRQPFFWSFCGGNITEMLVHAQMVLKQFPAWSVYNYHYAQQFGSPFSVTLAFIQVQSGLK